MKKTKPVHKPFRNSVLNYELSQQYNVLMARKLALK